MTRSTANPIDFLDPDQRAARAALLDVFDLLPRPLRIAVWDSVEDVVTRTVIDRFLALGRAGRLDTEAATLIAAEIRRQDQADVREAHETAQRRGSSGSPHVMAEATILRTLGRPPARKPLRQPERRRALPRVKIRAKNTSRS